MTDDTTRDTRSALRPQPGVAEIEAVFGDAAPDGSYAHARLLAQPDWLLAWVFALWDQEQRRRGARSDLPLFLAEAERVAGVQLWPRTSMLANLRAALATARVREE